ncbi:MAG: ABC transporter ATP-binding protein, partial [Pseudomonadales bacterium]|nr:ABC transporter ATP-binding protein [Pseudomonadales bacterium]
MGNALLTVNNLCVSFTTDEACEEVLHNISFSLENNELLGIVGESGSGKSVTSLAIMGLLPKPAGRITAGSINFDNTELTRCKGPDYYRIRGRRISMIFQEPVSALNPVQSIGSQLAEVYKLHFPDMTESAIRKASITLLDKVNIHHAEKCLSAYPHELSGGICQRVMIAMALACQPEILIADEPTTALDVTTQKQILELLKELQPAFGMSVIFITHDLGVVSELCDRAIVMQDGHIRETASVESLFDNPQH